MLTLARNSGFPGQQLSQLLDVTGENEVMCSLGGRGDIKESSVCLGKRSPTRSVILVAIGGAGIQTSGCWSRLCEAAVLERGLNRSHTWDS